MNEEASEELNLVSNEAIYIGIGLSLTCVLLACCLIVWVRCNHKSPVVRAMQPIFLIMLCFGTMMSSLSIIFLGVDESSKIDAGIACGVYPWLMGIGDTLIISSLFTKLWRVNQVFHAERFERKVVTVKRVLWPLVVFITLDLGLLLVATLVDPIVWVREPIIYNDKNETVRDSIDVDEIETIGYCKGEGNVGEVLIGLVSLINFIALVSNSSG